MGSIKTIKTAVVQMVSLNNNKNANMQKAQKYIVEAVNKGTKLVLLPEFAITGYELNENLWDQAETIDGETVSWLKELSQKYSIWIGVTFLQIDGEDFYNNFILTNPDGKIDGVVSKEFAGSVETYLFKGKKTPHIIDSEFGRVGVIICYDTIKSEALKALVDKDIDILLLPHSAAQPSIIPIFFPKSAVDFLNNYMKDNASRLSKLFGVPSLLANKTGVWKSDMPKPYPSQDGKFMGYSTITNSDGEVLSQIHEEEMILIQELVLDKEKKKKDVVIEDHGGFSVKVTWHFKWWSFVESKGKKFYQNSKKRLELVKR